MTNSHKRGKGGRLNRAPVVIAHAQAGRYQVLHRVPQVQGDPEHAVCRGEQSGLIIALFYQAEDAAWYCRWRNEKGQR